MRWPGFCALLAVVMACHAEFRVNTYTTDDQQYPAIAGDGSGNFVIVWLSGHYSSRTIYGQRFNADGTPLGGEFQVNTTTSSSPKEPDVAMDAAGNFVIVWQEPDDNDEGIYGRRFAANGQPLTDAFLVNTYTDMRQIEPSIAMNENGEFVITWTSGHDPGHRTYVTGRKYYANGIPYGPEFLVTQLTNGHNPDVVIDDSGDFVVAWLRSGDSDDPPMGEFIRFRRYNVNGTAKGDAVQIADDVANYNYPSIGMDGSGNFVITWVELLDSYDICARRFDANGNAIARQFGVNTYRPDAQLRSSVAVANDGRFVVVWHGPGDGSDRTVLGQKYASDGTAVGDEFQINTYITGHQWLAQVAIRDDGEFVTVWQSEGQDGDGYGIFGEFGEFPKRIITVDDDATGANDGSSWTDAYNYLQDALADASSPAEPVEILVAQGTYRPDENTLHPDGTGDREAAFRLVGNMTLKGGYAGVGEPDPNKRDIETYETILSGDLAGNDGPDFANNAENSYHVVTGGASGETTILDGFTITGGNANGPDSYSRRGGGIQLYPDLGFTLTNCTIIHNSAESCGGGMLSGWSSCCFTINNCRFISNRAGSQGGGLYLTGESIPNITNCIFSGNSAVTGGAIYNYEGYPGIVNCTFSGNRASDECGGVLDLEGISAFKNCILWANTDKDGSDESAQIAWVNPIHINFSCVQGWTGILGGTANIDVDPCFVDPGNWDANGTPEDANDDFWVDGDYHLKSLAGRYDPNTQTWVIDDDTSPCIDAGDPMSPIGPEPFPNGGVVNMGAFGGTAGASKSYFGEPVCETIVAGDINGDCEVNFKDFRLMALHWMEDHNP